MFSKAVLSSQLKRLHSLLKDYGYPFSEKIDDKNQSDGIFILFNPTVERLQIFYILENERQNLDHPGISAVLEEGDFVVNAEGIIEIPESTPND